MRAILCTDFTGIEGLEMGEIDSPVAEDDEVLIEVYAASVSFMDYLMASGGYQLRPPLPYAPGTEAVGVVREVGKDVRHFKPGDRIAGSNWYGGIAEQMVAKEWKCVHVPDGVGDAPAATVLHAYLTAYCALIVQARLRAGETILITGAAGGVGLATIDLARKLGARIIAGVGSDDKAEIVRRYGAETVVNYRTEDLRERLRALTDGRGIDVCLENVGGEIFMQVARMMNYGGRLMPIGFTSGEIPELPMDLPLVKNYSIIGFVTYSWTDRFKEESMEAARKIMQWVSEGELHPHVDRALPMNEAGEAFRAIADREVQGRVVIALRSDDGQGLTIPAATRQ